MFLRAVRIAERRGLLFHELLLRLRTIGRQFGEGAAWLELALQTALADEEAAWQREQVEEADRKT